MEQITLEQMNEKFYELNKKFENLLEEVGILMNPELILAIMENNEAKSKGVKTWKLQPHK